MCRLLCVALGILLTDVTVFAQKISASLDRNKILIGEHVTLQLKAEDINIRKTFIQNWFNVYDSTEHIKTVKREPVDTIDVIGLTTYVQKFTLTSFDSGKWKLTPLQIIIQERATGKQTVLKADSIFIDVLPVDVSAMQNYHDVKDILEVEAKPNYILYTAIAASVVILAILIWLLVKRMKKQKPQPVKIAYKGTPLEIALQQIKELQRELRARNEVKMFYIKLTTICRNYFHEQLHVSSSQSTSDELMVLLSVYLQNETKRSQFYQLLRLGDAVKFAKYIPEEEQNNEAIQTAITSLQHIDALIKSMKQHA